MHRCKDGKMHEEARFPEERNITGGRDKGRRGKTREGGQQVWGAEISTKVRVAVNSP